jgi:hypothetical protein
VGDETDVLVHDANLQQQQQQQQQISNCCRRSGDSSLDAHLSQLANIYTPQRDTSTLQQLDSTHLNSTIQQPTANLDHQQRTHTRAVSP